MEIWEVLLVRPSWWVDARANKVRGKRQQKTAVEQENGDQTRIREMPNRLSRQQLALFELKSGRQVSNHLQQRVTTGRAAAATGGTRPIASTVLP